MHALLPDQAEPDEEVLKEVIEVPFSGEEVGGRYLDLHTHYHVFVNAKFGAQLDYIEYLTSFAKLEEVPRPQRLTKPYRLLFPPDGPWLTLHTSWLQVEMSGLVCQYYHALWTSCSTRLVPWSPSCLSTCCNACAQMLFLAADPVCMHGSMHSCGGDQCSAACCCRTLQSFLMDD